MKLDAESVKFQPMADSSSTAVISAVESGTTNKSLITLGPIPDPLGRSVAIDIRIDNVTSGFWGWTLPMVNWNTTFLNLTKVEKGSFLSHNTGDEPTSFIGNSPSLWFNFDGYVGRISGGLSEGILGSALSKDSSGVIATLTFLVKSPGSTNITIDGGSLKQNGSSSGVNVTCNNISLSLFSLTPTPTVTPSPPPTASAVPVTPTPTLNPSSTQTTGPTNANQPTSTPSIPEFPMWVVIIAFLLLPLIALVFISLNQKKPDRLYILYNFPSIP
jgi:hypothetical protein